MSRPYEIGDTSQHWQAVVRQYMDGKDLSFEELGQRIGLSRVTVARLLALPRNTTYRRKRWRAPLLNNALRALDMPPALVRKVNILAAREDGYLV